MGHSKCFGHNFFRLQPVCNRYYFYLLSLSGIGTFKQISLPPNMLTLICINNKVLSYLQFSLNLRIYEVRLPNYKHANDFDLILSKQCRYTSTMTETIKATLAVVQFHTL